MLRGYFQNGGVRSRPRWPVLALLGLGGLAIVLLVLAVLFVGFVLFIPLALLAVAIQGLRRLLRSPLSVRGDGRSNVRVIPRDEV